MSRKTKLFPRLFIYVNLGERRGVEGSVALALTRLPPPPESSGTPPTRLRRARCACASKARSESARLAAFSFLAPRCAWMPNLVCPLRPVGSGFLMVANHKQAAQERRLNSPADERLARKNEVPPGWIAGQITRNQSFTVSEIAGAVPVRMPTRANTRKAVNG